MMGLSAARRIWRSFAKDRGGMVAVEFGLLAPPFFGMILGLLQTSYDYYLLRALDVTAQNAARLVMVGEAQKRGLDTAQKLRDELCRNLPPFLSCASLIVDVQPVTQFTGSEPLIYAAPPASVTDATYNLGSSGQYRIVQAYYPAPFFSLYGSANVVLSGGGRVRNYRQTAVVRVE